MRYELMNPSQIRKAISERWPVILPLGVLEYHGEHLPLGMDTLAVTKVMERLEQEMDIVILPAFYYGACSFAVEKPEGKGSIHVDSQALLPLARQIFLGLLRVGFRNIHAVVHHQSENFASGMPTDLAFRLAAKQIIFEFLDQTRGEGWWGDNSMDTYYTAHDDLDANPFNWIQCHPLMDAAIIAQYPFDHAGAGETSLMLELCPEEVEMELFSQEKWYIRSAAEASRELGARGVALILERWRKILA